MDKLSFQFCPTNLAARALPKNFPLTATRIIKPVIFHNSGSLIRPISVLNPVNTKNRGSKMTNATSSTFSMKRFLNKRVPGSDFKFVLAQRGMFSYSGLTRDQVRRLREEKSIYTIDTGRICVAALTSKNVDYVADAIAEVIR